MFECDYLNMDYEYPGRENAKFSLPGYFCVCESYMEGRM